MNDDIRHDIGEPLHSQVRELIRRQALSGELVDETGRLMTEAELVRHFGVSRVTIRSAIAPLVEAGLFERTAGRGTFLRNTGAEHWMGQLRGFQEIIAEQGYAPGAKILEQGMIRVDSSDIRDALDERAVWQLRRVRYADDTPIAIEHAFYPPDIGLLLDKRDLVNIRMYEVFDKELDLPIGTADQTLGAKLSDAEEQDLLNLDGLTALMQMRRTTISRSGRPVEFLRAVYRTDIFRFAINLRRA